MKLFACRGSGNCMKPWLVMSQLQIDFDLSLIDVQKGEQKSDGYRAINALGVGGTNAHAILAEAPERAASEESDFPNLLLILLF